MALEDVSMLEVGTLEDAPVLEEAAVAEDTSLLEADAVCEISVLVAETIEDDPLLADEVSTAVGEAEELELDSEEDEAGRVVSDDEVKVSLLENTEEEAWEVGADEMSLADEETSLLETADDVTSGADVDDTSLVEDADKVISGVAAGDETSLLDILDDVDSDRRRRCNEAGSRFRGRCR